MIMTKVTYEDEYLFSLLKQGNQDAFTQLYNKYSSMLYGLSYRYLQDRNLAEDVVQQVFSHLWEVHSTCHIKVHLRNYLYTMTKNYLLNMIRDTNDIIAREDMKGTEQNNIIDDGLQEKLEEERKFGYLRWAVKQLPSCKREICLLKIYRGLNNQEIADELNIPINTVKCYYTQSLKLLKYYLRNHVE